MEDELQQKMKFWNGRQLPIEDLMEDKLEWKTAFDG